jgi:hypothetical protein
MARIASRSETATPILMVSAVMVGAVMVSAVTDSLVMLEAVTVW